MLSIHIWEIFMTTLLTLVTFVVLYLLLWCKFLAILGVVVLAMIIADFFIKIFRDSLPKILMQEVSDKAVLITGCDTGFGNILARQLDAKGVTVFAGCLFADGPDALKLKENCSKNLHILQLDVTKEEHVKTAVKNVINNLEDKKLWAIVNNAGIGIGSEMEYSTIDMTKKTMEVNTIGIVRVTQAFLPLLRQSKGRVVIMASVAGRLPSVLMGSYSMSKFATVAFAEVLRMEVMKWGISVHTIDPWIFKTKMTQKENSLPLLLREWKLASESVKAEYGGDSYEKGLEKFSNLYQAASYPETKLHLVTECMMDATIGKYPQMRYSPGIVGRIVLYACTKTLESIFILISGIFLVPNVKKPQKKANLENNIEVMS